MSVFSDRDLADVDIDEINQLLDKLTPEELEQLNSEVDPDDSYLPARDRVKDQTKKAPTGKYDREKLLKFLEDQGKNEKDWDLKPFVKETRGKVWQPPVREPVKHDDNDVGTSTEWDELLENASEAEIVELAAILGFTGLVNQVQFHAAETTSQINNVGGWNAAAKAEMLKFVPPEPDNQTDVDDSIKRVTSNDSTLTQLNLNNIKNISYEKMQQLIDGMKKNTNVQTLSLANIEMPDSIGKVVAEMLEENKTLLTLNIESNRLTGTVIADVVRSTLKNKTLIDLRLSNQRSQLLGNKVEMDIANTIAQNETLLRLGLHLETLGPRVKVQETLKHNWDRLRKKRISNNQN